MKVTMIGIDLAKTIFQVCGVNQAGNMVFNRAVTRAKLLAFLDEYPDVVIAMEACPGSNYWGRTLQAKGFKVLLIPPQHVKPFVKGNKNDRNDAFAITETARRPHMRFVIPRSLAQTDMILIHRLRERRVKQRTALINQLRGFLSEYGIVLRSGKQVLEMALPDLLEDGDNGLTPACRALVANIQEEWQILDNTITELDKRIKQQARGNEDALRLMAIKGVAERVSTAAIAHAGNGSAYQNGRHFSANLGLVPKEHSSGGKQKLGGITKRGNRYLRRLLIQGAWSVVRNAAKSDDRLSRWAAKLVERRGKHKAVVAVANKMARIIWSMLYHQSEYKAA
jgi:transposase